MANINLSALTLHSGAPARDHNDVEADAPPRRWDTRVCAGEHCESLRTPLLSGVTPYFSKLADLIADSTSKIMATVMMLM
jgi:hypothetical protein